MGEATPRTQIRRIENVEAFPLVSLRAAQALREWLDGKEAEGLRRAREMGASLEDIADALGITRQGVSYKLHALSERGEPAEDDVIIDVREPEDEASTSTPASSEPSAPGA
jgi:DNA-binding MarR family transcriptional regulator